MASILDLDRDILNKLSELDELERLQSFSLLTIPISADFGVPGPTEVGPGRAFCYIGGFGTPTYIGPDSQHAVGKWNRIKEKTELARKLLNATRGASDESKEQRSAAALQTEMVDKNNQMAWWSAATQEAENQIMRFLSLWEKHGYNEPEYAKDFNGQELTAQIADAVQLNSIPCMAGQPIAEVVKPLVKAILVANEVDDSKIEECLRAIDNGIKRSGMPGMQDDQGRNTPVGLLGTNQDGLPKVPKEDTEPRDMLGGVQD
jgi:hypothetical protein